MVLTNITVETLWERRDRLNIMAEIIEVSKGGKLKTQIMYKVNLSFSQLKDYLSFLTEKGFLKVYVENKKKIYVATAKGNLYIENYMEMSDLLRPHEAVVAKILAR